MKSLLTKISLIIAAVGPGLFLIGYNIGTGSITTMASAGAKYGMTMVWPLLLSCIFTFIMIIAFGRYTVVTGETALFAIRRHFGKGLAIFALVSFLLSEWISCMGVMGVVTEVVKEWSRPLTASGAGFNQILLAALFGAFLYFLFWRGSYRFFEKILAIFVSIMGLSFLFTMFMVIPEPMQVIEGLVPRLPTESNAALIMAGMVGTTMGGILYVVRSILVQEKGWTLKDLTQERRDAMVSAVFMFILSVAVMACAAGTLYPRGLQVENAIDMVKLLEPLAGRFAVSIFVGGIVSAGLSSLFPITLLAPWLFADYRNKPRNMRATSSRLLVLFGVLLGLVVPIFGGRPVLVMIVSQALCIMATPLVILLILILLNRKSLMGDKVISKSFSIWIAVIFLFTLAMAVSGIVGIVGMI